MLTIFAVPKPFDDHTGIIQRNAIRSWSRLHPRCQILLCGDESGIEEAAKEIGAEWNSDVARNEFGTPLLSSVFRIAEERAVFPLLCYVNADIILLSDLIEAAHRVASLRSKFLMVGQRWDLDVTEELAFDEQNWESVMRFRARTAGCLHQPDGSDYFVYPRGTMGP